MTYCETMVWSDCIERKTFLLNHERRWKVKHFYSLPWAPHPPFTPTHKTPTQNPSGRVKGERRGRRWAVANQILSETAWAGPHETYQVFYLIYWKWRIRCWRRWRAIFNWLFCSPHSNVIFFDIYQQISRYPPFNFHKLSCCADVHYYYYILFTSMSMHCCERRNCELYFHR